MLLRKNQDLIKLVFAIIIGVIFIYALIEYGKKHASIVKQSIAEVLNATTTTALTPNNSTSKITPTIIESGPNYKTYPIVPIKKPAASGSTTTDPIFDTLIMRLTDATDGSNSCTIGYSYWPVFNMDSSRIAVECDFQGHTYPEFFEINKDTLVLSHRISPHINCASDMIWSATDKDVMYCRSGPPGAGLSSYNVLTGGMVLVKDFSYMLSGGSLNQMSKSLDDNRFAFTVTNSNGKFIGYMVWEKSSDKVILKNLDPVDEQVDEVQIDKSGKFLTVSNDSGNTHVWNLDNMEMTKLASGVDGYFHEDTGKGILVSSCDPNNLCIRNLATPHLTKNLLSFSDYSQGQVHFSMLADDERWALITSEEGADRGGHTCNVTLPFQCEIYQVATDGSGKVRRLVHHYSTATDYSRSAFGNINRDGNLIAWASDWGNQKGRVDVYIAKISPAE
ncbi:MAG: uncharacterized protein JWN37_337 [Candidatus Nomurabacteria bacterium]|nr:uncharacterized protein [Candidatus Nomurabacteria bacterium]